MPPVFPSPAPECVSFHCKFGRAAPGAAHVQLPFTNREMPFWFRKSPSRVLVQVPFCACTAMGDSPITRTAVARTRFRLTQAFTSSLRDELVGRPFPARRDKTCRSAPAQAYPIGMAAVIQSERGKCHGGATRGGACAACRRWTHAVTGLGQDGMAPRRAPEWPGSRSVAGQIRGNISFTTMGI